MNTELKPAGGSSFSRLSASAPGAARRKPRIVQLTVAVVAVLLATLFASLWISSRSAKAQAAFDAAMDVYDTPVQQPGERPIPNVKTYTSVEARAKAAHPLFQAAADTYGLFRAGQNARYFSGLTAKDMGEVQTAEADLKKAAGGRDGGVSALAKLALAGFYMTAGRQGDAAQLYENLIAHPTLTVPANAARLALADSIAGTNPQRARALYAQVKDSDKTTAAGQVAAQKLAAM